MNTIMDLMDHLVMLGVLGVTTALMLYFNGWLMWAFMFGQLRRLL